MKNIPTLLLCLTVSIFSTAQIPQKTQLNNFNQAYTQNPSIPLGLLEAVAYSKTRLTNINPKTDVEGCSGLPMYTGVMGLIEDGKGYFKNTVDLVAAKSSYTAKNIILDPETGILAYAEAFSQIQLDLGITSNGVEANIPVLRYLSELPTQTGGQLFAQDAELYQILKFMEDPDFMQSVQKSPFQINFKTIFGQNNFQILKAKKLMFNGTTITNSMNKTYQPNQQLMCIDYPGVIWVSADPSNYSSRGGTAVSAVTIHTIQGSYAGAISWFQNPSANVSAHYVLRSSDGQVTQMVCESDKGWHVGSANPYSIGLEHEGYVSNPAWYTVAMYGSSADVCRDIINSGYGINSLRTAFWPWAATSNYNSGGRPGSCTKIKGHQHFPSQTHTDPGANWDWNYFYMLINDPPPTTNITNCSGSFTDSGGNSGNYGDDERNLTVIEPVNASSVTITFSSFDLEFEWDYMYIYDGNSVWAPLIGTYNGTSSPGSITSSGGALAIEFRSDCATNNAGWEATWTCSTVLAPPANLAISAPSCANSNYTATLSWDNADSNWYADVSTDPGFATFWNKPVPWMTSTTAPTGFSDSFGLGPLNFEPDSTYYWRIWDGSSWINGPSFMVPFCPDTTPPTTLISNSNIWETMDFSATFTDADMGGSGVDLSFYQVLDFDWTEWRANNGNGFFNDNFDNAIHSEWSIATGTWAISGAALNQSDEGASQTNINVPLTQVNSEIYLYHWQANTQSGGSANRRQGLHFYSDNAGLPNGGNSYFVYFRANSNKCQVYKVISDVWSLEVDTALVVNENTWYDHKVLFNPSSGEIKIYMDDVLVAEWTDSSPHTSGSGIFLRTGNADVLFNDLKVYKARTGSETISIGPGATNDVRYQNPNPTTPSCRIKSLVKDVDENWSTLGSLNVNIDWTNPSDVTVNDGTGADVDTVCLLTELSANWAASVDTHSAVVRYWYAIGTTPGGTDIINWLDNGTNTSVTQMGLSLQAGTTYYFTIRVENGAGLFSSDISSDGQTPSILQIVASADTTQITLPDSVIVFTDATTNAATWNWSFPGGSPGVSTLQTKSVDYDAAGSYDVSLTVTDVYGCTANLNLPSYIVVSDPPPAPPISGFTSDQISGCESLIVNFTDASSNVPTSWLWLFPGGDTSASTNQNPTIAYLNPGSYTVTLITTNFFGSDTLIMSNYITVFPNPIISVSSDTIICEGESATLSAFGASAYLWNTGQTDSVISVSPSTTTTYSVNGTSNGCWSVQEDIVVSVTSVPLTTITPDQNLCSGDSLIITASGGDSYAWNTGDTSASITVESNTIPATYTVIISTDACADFDTISSTITAVPQPSADFLASDTVVALQNATIAFTNTSSSASQFFWDFGDGNTSALLNPSNTYADTGWYSITLIADNAECAPDTLILSSYIHVVPNQTFANFTSSSSSICAGDSVQFTDASSNAPISWSWLFPGGSTSSSTDQNPTITYPNAGTYSVTLIATNLFGSDTLVMTDYITVYPNPIISVSNDTSICEGETATLSAFGASTYSWSTGETDSVITVSPQTTTTYTVSGSSNGCGSQQEDIVISVTTIPTTTITPSQNICFGDSITITATGGNAYSWNTGASGASITVGSSTPSATYTVIISKDACTDFDTSSTTITTVQKPIADFQASNTVVELQNAMISFTNTSSSATIFDWDLGDGNTSTSFNPINTYLDTGWYTVILVAANPECEPDTSVKQTYIHVTPNFPIANFTSGADTICTGDSVQFVDASTNVTTYAWTFTGGLPATSSDQDPMVLYNSSGTYNVELIASGPGGTDTQTQVYTIEVRLQPIADFATADTLLIQPNTTATFTNGSINADGYAWDFGDGNSSSDPSPWNIYSGLGVYTVTLIAQSDYCPDDTIAMDSLIHVETGIGVTNNSITNLGLQISPNPASQYIIVSKTSDAEILYELFNSIGQLVLSGEMDEMYNRLDVSSLAEGTYLFQAQSEEKRIIQKIVISR